jgi:hypothetical protein
MGSTSITNSKAAMDEQNIDRKQGDKPTSKHVWVLKPTQMFLINYGGI